MPVDAPIKSNRSIGQLAAAVKYVRASLKIILGKGH